MSKQSNVDDEDGSPTHVREVSDDGSSSTLYEYDNSFVANLIGDHRGKPVEWADHNKDGTTDAYEYDDSFVASLVGDHRGEKKNDDGGCFLTTACVRFAGLPDDCLELTTLRQFRDDFVAEKKGGRELLEEYYAIAPKIVSFIETSPRRHQILAATFEEIQAAVADIQAKEQKKALQRYVTLFASLKASMLREETLISGISERTA
jgi:hypothetical protein